MDPNRGMFGDMNKGEGSVATRLADHLEANLTSLVERLVATYRHNPGYAALDENAYAEDLTPVSIANCRLLAQRLRGHAPDSRDVAVISESGARRVAQGIPEAEVARAYRLWSMAIWTEITEAARVLGGIGSDDLVPLAAVVLEHNEHAGGLAADAYEGELRGIWVQTTPVDHGLLDRLVAGVASPEEVSALEDECFDRPSRPLSMILVTTRDGLSPSVQGNNAVRRVVAGWRADIRSSGFVSVFDKVVMLVGPMSGAEAWESSIAGFAESGVVMAIEPHVVGVAGAFERLPELKEAVVAARVLPARRKPFQWRETILASIGMSAPDAVRSRLNHCVALLEEHEARHGTPVRETLEAYLDHNMSVMATAEALFCHPNTVRYRLARVSELTSLDVASAPERTVLTLALSMSKGS